jgi:hypothetical protein
MYRVYRGSIKLKLPKLSLTSKLQQFGKLFTYYSGHLIISFYLSTFTIITFTPLGPQP